KKNRNKIKIRREKYYEKNRDIILGKARIRTRKYYEKNRAKAISYSTNWNKENPVRRLSIIKKCLKKQGFPLKMDPFAYQHAITAWSASIKKRDSNQCQVCLSQADVSHHILHKSKYPALSLNINNGIALCNPCHNECHGWRLEDTMPTKINLTRDC
ncbi:MAG: hypothetical protein KC444_07865, partial [Nitrosopumilus sp.]|nr:hypothetical protein [Nitrosopumilus sp.]